MVEGPLRGWGPRLLAPLAFFAAATILVLVIQSALSAEGASPRDTAVTQATGPAPTSTGGEASGTQTSDSKPTRKKVYRVKSGDTLDSIAARFDTTTADLLELNPDIDPLSLTVGQRIRVR